MTVEQYRQLPDQEDVIQELHLGMAVTLSRPKMKHAKLQLRLVELLRPKAEHLGLSQPKWPSGRFPSTICGEPT